MRRDGELGARGTDFASCCQGQTTLFGERAKTSRFLCYRRRERFADQLTFSIPAFHVGWTVPVTGGWKQRSIKLRDKKLFESRCAPLGLRDSRLLPFLTIMICANGCTSNDHRHRDGFSSWLWYTFGDCQTPPVEATRTTAGTQQSSCMPAHWYRSPYAI